MCLPTETDFAKMTIPPAREPIPKALDSQKEQRDGVEDTVDIVMDVIKTR